MAKILIKFSFVLSLLLYLGGLSVKAAHVETHQKSTLSYAKAVDNSKTPTQVLYGPSASPSLPAVPGPSDPPCCTVIIRCPNGFTFMAIVCNGQDYENWVAIYCGCDPD